MTANSLLPQRWCPRGAASGNPSVCSSLQFSVLFTCVLCWFVIWIVHSYAYRCIYVHVSLSVFSRFSISLCLFSQNAATLRMCSISVANGFSPALLIFILQNSTGLRLHCSEAFTHSSLSLCLFLLLSLGILLISRIFFLF